MELNREQIIKALECCLLSNEHQEEECNKCPFEECPYTICQNLLAYHSLSLIKELTEEIETLEKAKYIYATVDYCADDLAEALEENKRLTEENEKLTSIGINKDIVIEGINDVILKLNEENERLKADNEALTPEIKKLLKAAWTVEADTVKKMQERLKKELRSGNAIMDKSISDIIDQIAKEMLEERE